MLSNNSPTQTPTLSKINLIYATQTGTSQDLAKQFYLTHQQSMRINLYTNISTIEQFSPNDRNCLWLFFISTTGQGDFPYSMRKLWKKMLLKSFSNLSWMKFSIYSFGDRSYGDNFCLAARKFRQRLIGLGAQEVVEIGLGDEQQPNGYLQEYRDKWFPNLVTFVEQNTQIKKGIEEKQQQKEYQLQSGRSQIKPSATNKPSELPNQIYSKFLIRQQICSNKGRRTFTIDLQIKNLQVPILCGDILSIYPHNNPQHVQWLLNYFKLTDQDCPKDSQKTYKQFFTKELNISSTLCHSFFIKRNDLKDLSFYCSDEMFKAKLLELDEDYDEYHNYIKKYKRNIIEVLTDFEIKLPPQDFVKRCTPIIPRKYSICQVLSSSEKDPTSLQLTQNIRILYRLVESKINENRIHKGLCSHDFTFWINVENAQRRCEIVKGEFQFQEQKENNLIAISLGTGVAPFYQFFDMALAQKNKWNMLVFYTNRFQNQIYFQDYIESLSELEILDPHISLTGAGGKRVTRLVQDNISSIKKFIQRASNNNLKIMICGPKQACEALQNILSRDLDLDFKSLRKKKIFLYENW